MEAARRAIGMPADIGGAYYGEAAEFTRSLSDQPLLVAIAIVSIYIVLGILYESFVHPFTVITTLPSAGLGRAAGADGDAPRLFRRGAGRRDLLMGIVKKNAIMMIDFALELQRAPGVSAQDAILRAAQMRLRPIVMTTVAALLGAAPLALSSGRGANCASARRHHHRRPADFPASHALHHAGDVSCRRALPAQTAPRSARRAHGDVETGTKRPGPRRA